jgi:hypothetical protein
VGEADAQKALRKLARLHEKSGFRTITGAMALNAHGYRGADVTRGAMGPE